MVEGTNEKGRDAMRGTFTKTAVIGAAYIACAAGCISSDSKVLNAGEGCEEIRGTSMVPESLKVDPHVRIFAQATMDLRGAATVVRKQAKETCARIAVDLGAMDTWSGLGEVDEALSNQNGTGACDAAAREVDSLLSQGGQAKAIVAVDIARGDCHVDFAEQTRCDDACKLKQICDSGTVETRCEPAALSCKCDSMCRASAICSGRPDRPANCMGKCESTCVGLCKGKCVAADGTVTENNPNCMGKCASSCNGQCKGHCKIEEPAGIACGVDVRCTGGCSGSFREPVCVTEFTPPKCQVDQACHAACSAQAAANAICDPPIVKIFADLKTSPQLQPLVTTLETNLPALLSVGEAQGKLALDAVNRLSASGQVVGADVEQLDPKSLACAGVASGTVAQILGSLQISTKASARVHLMTTQGTL
jgi:hypothetical protein